MVVISAALTEIEAQKIDAIVERGCFMNRSDFVRSAIREFLEGFSQDEAKLRTVKE